MMAQRESPNVLLLEGIHPAAQEWLHEQGASVRTLDGAVDQDDLLEHLKNVEVLGIRSRTKITPELLDAAGNLAAIGCFCIGTNQVDLDEARKRGIVVFNAPFSNTRSVAEMTLAEIISLSRGITQRNAQMHGGQWHKSAKSSHEVRGRVLGIVGYGHIGSQLSVLAEALGMQVIYHDIVPKLPLGNARPAGSLQQLLQKSDFVSLHVPETMLTRGMIGAEQIGMIRPGGFIINNARGSLIDEAALEEALDSGHIAGAAIDVFSEEPSRNDSEFQCRFSRHDNVILTPHIGGSTEEAQENIARDVALKLDRYINDGTTTSSVNIPEVELPTRRPDQHRIMHFHRNVPGVLGRMHTLLAELDVNINAEYLQSDQFMSYVILDVEPMEGDSVRRGLQEIPETIRLRTLW